MSRETNPEAEAAEAVAPANPVGTQETPNSQDGRQIDDSLVYWWGVNRIVAAIGIPALDVVNTIELSHGRKLHVPTGYYIPANVIIFPRPIFRDDLA